MWFVSSVVFNACAVELLRLLIVGVGLVPRLVGRWWLVGELSWLACCLYPPGRSP